jgi:hypothetical protein
VVDTVETVNSRIKFTPENRPSGIKNAIKKFIKEQIKIERFLTASVDSKNPAAATVLVVFSAYQRTVKKYRLLSKKALRSFDFA